MVITYPIKRSLYVNLTNRCPCDCAFCLRNSGSGVHGSGSLWLEREPEVGEVLSSIASRDPKEIDELVFCGYGEPTERLDALLEIAGEVRKLYPQFKIRLNTNGLSDLINGRKTAGEFKGLIDTVSVSLNATNAEDYERICRPRFGRESYQAMLDFTSQCVSSIPCVVMSVVGEPVTSLEDIEKCRSIAAGVGATLRVRAFES